MTIGAVRSELKIPFKNGIFDWYYFFSYLFSMKYLLLNPTIYPTAEFLLKKSVQK